MLQQVLASMKPVFERRSATVSVHKRRQRDFILDGVAVNLSYMVYNFSGQRPEVQSARKPNIEVTLKEE